MPRKTPWPSNLKRPELGGKVQHVKSSMQAGISMLRRLAYYIPRTYLKQLAHGLVLSKARYGLAVYGTVRMSASSPESGLMRPLEVSINDTMRVIEGRRRRDGVSIAALREATMIPSVNQMTIQAMLMEAWKAQHLESSPIADLMPTVEGRKIATRSITEGHVKVPYGSKISRSSFSHQAAMLWNGAPQALRGCEEKNSAKRQIKSYTARSFP